LENPVKFTGDKGGMFLYGREDEDNPFEEGADAYTDWLIEHRIKQRSINSRDFFKLRYWELNCLLM
jgi:hypothetical protein